MVGKTENPLLWKNSVDLGIQACVCMLAKSLQLCPTLWDPMSYSPLNSSVHGILQARILEWVAMPFSGDLSNPGMEPALAGSFFSTSTIWEAHPRLLRRKYLPTEAFHELYELYTDSLQGQVHTAIRHRYHELKSVMHKAPRVNLILIENRKLILCPCSLEKETDPVVNEPLTTLYEREAEESCSRAFTGVPLS